MVTKKVIFCGICKKYLGEIRDAKLRKGIAFLCAECETKRIASGMRKKSDIKDFFGGILRK
jgi:hypothetical protein